MADDYKFDETQIEEEFSDYGLANVEGITEGNIPTDTDIKINPSFYIHITLVNAINSGMRESLQEGFARFEFYVMMLESTCKANHYLDEDYEKQIAQSRKEIDETKFSDNPIKDRETKNIRHSIKKYELLQQKIFRAKPIISNFKV